MDSQSTARIHAVIKEQEDTQDVYEKALARVASLNVLNADELTEITQALRERASALRVWKEKTYKKFDVEQHVGLLLEKAQTAQTHISALLNDANALRNDGNALLDDAKAASRVADAIGWRRFWQKDVRRAHKEAREAYKEALEQSKLLLDQSNLLIDQAKLLSEASDSEIRELSEAQKLFETAIQEAEQAFLHFQEVATRFDAIAVPFFEACQRIVDGAGDVPAPE